MNTPDDTEFEVRTFRMLCPTYEDLDPDLVLFEDPKTGEHFAVAKADILCDALDRQEARRTP